MPELTGDLGDQFNLYNSSMGGELKGLVQMRDGNNGENFRGTVNSIGKTTIDGVDYKTVTVGVTETYLTDIKKCTLSDTGGKINLGNQIFYYTQWTYDDATKEYTFVIDESKNGAQLNETRRNKQASIGQNVDYQGVPYYMAQMNEWLRTFAEAFNNILTEGYNLKNEKGTILFTANDDDTGEQALFKEHLGVEQQNGQPKTTVGVYEDSYYRLTAKNAAVLQSLINDPDLMGTKVGQTEGVDEYKNVERLMNMINDERVVSFRGGSTAEFLTCILSDIALSTNSSKTFTSNFKNIGQSIDTQRMSISGVDQDEEAVNLVKYQNAYNLASKMIQTLTEVYDRLILQTGV